MSHFLKKKYTHSLKKKDKYIIGSMNDLKDNKEEVCIVVAGSVDSGKSTFIGILDKNILDDGNGYARKYVAKHKHELESGRTSDISVKSIKNNNKSIVLVDLCGHAKYLKTTLFGITGYFPDYAIVTVAANRGVLPMTREHLGILLYMKIPIIIVITKIDIAPKKIYERTIKTVDKIIKIPKFKKKPLKINSDKAFYTDQKNINLEEQKSIKYIENIVNLINNDNKYIPVITISNKTGYYVNVIKKFINLLKPREKWRSNFDGSIFYIDSTFTPPGVGLVLSGLLKGKNISIGDTILIGPFNKEYIPASVWSIHDNSRNNIKTLSNSQRGCLAIRINKKNNFTRKQIRKGMVCLSDNSLTIHTCYEFYATIDILNHSTTINNNYSPVIHCGIIKQSAQISISDKENLRTGDQCKVKFKFLYYPEFIQKGLIFFFREGKTRGVGIIDSIIPIK
jgi:elongation factor 1-alpha